MSARKVELRLDEEVWQRIRAFEYEHHLPSPNEAIRALIDIATRDLPALDAALRKAAWRVGIREGGKKLKAEIDAAVVRSLGAADG